MNDRVLRTTPITACRSQGPLLPFWGGAPSLLWAESWSCRASGRLTRAALASRPYPRPSSMLRERGRPVCDSCNSGPAAGARFPRPLPMFILTFAVATGRTYLLRGTWQRCVLAPPPKRYRLLPQCFHKSRGGNAKSAP